jgi:hypothetical protein
VTYSNLSKIKTSFRTKGNITGNFGAPKSKAGSPLNDIGVSNKKVVKVVNPEDYLARLYHAYDKTDDPKLKRFLFEQIRAKLIQSNRWN